MPISKLIALFKGKKPILLPDSARYIPRDQHCISRKQVSSAALKVLYRLKNKGFHSLLVGGCVRDLLLGREPKDFDIATNATPKQIQKSFSNSRLIGRRFQIMHVVFKGEIIEVCTFRGDHDPQESDEGMILHDNVYGDIIDDAKRRDFTVNALYYDINNFSVIDFHNGIEDLQQGILRIIGDPETRYREDPVRMLRAIRLASKLGFSIHSDTAQPIHHLGQLLQHIAPARLFTEMIKLFLRGQALETFKQLRHYNLLGFLFPLTEECLTENQFATTSHFINLTLSDTDTRVQAEKTVSPGYFVAAMLWHPLQQEIQALRGQAIAPWLILETAFTSLVAKQQQSAAIPRHFLNTAKTIWELQHRLEKRKKNQCLKLVEHKRFRAAYDFLLLRARSGEAVDKLADWWTNFYDAAPKQRQVILNTLHKSRAKKPRKKKPQ